jgi:hypothetical protein
VISDELLDYKPQSIYFRKRWGAALAWVEAQNKDGRLGNSGGVGKRERLRAVTANVDGPAQALQVWGEVGEIAGEMSGVRTAVQAGT